MWRLPRRGATCAGASPEAVAVEEALRRLDLAHRAPFSKAKEAEYCEAVERWAVLLRQQAGERVSSALRLGARAQHLERGAIPRSSYPEGREGYLRWRAAVKKRQGERVGEILRDLRGPLGVGCVERVTGLVAKALPLRPFNASGSSKAGDAEMQCIEDAACLVFLEQELKEGFADGKEDAKVVDILQKSWKKMSRQAHAEALRIDYSPRLLGLVVEAIAQAELPISGVSNSSAQESILFPVPELSTETQRVLVETWRACVEATGSVGEDWYAELRLDPTFDEDLGKVLKFPVCRSENVAKLIQAALDLLPAAMSSAPPPPTSVASIDAAPSLMPRFASLLRAASLLSQKHGGFRLRHLDAMRGALVVVVCRRGAPSGEAQKRCRQAWEALGYAMGSQVAPCLMLADPVSDFVAAVAAPLPTPGAGPCAAILAAKGVALVEMALGILRRKASGAAGFEAPTSLRSRACAAAADDANAYCGLLAAAIFDIGEGRAARRALWSRRCTEVPLEVAAVALAGIELARGSRPAVLKSAKSAIGDLDTGLALLHSAAEVSLHTAELNLHGRADGEMEDLASSALALAARVAILRGSAATA